MASDGISETGQQKKHQILQNICNMWEQFIPW